MRKGISPLVAVVTLIVFTLVVTGIIASWATQFAQQQRSAMEFCTDARVILLSGVYTDDGGTGNITLNIHNYGTVDLDFIVFGTFTNGAINKVGEAQIAAGDIGQFYYYDVDITTVDQFTVQADKCPGAQDLIKANDIKTI
jgi:flagellin-like protein